MHNQSAAPFISSHTFLQVIAQAYSSYREELTAAEFVLFLHRHIFAELGKVSVEIYFYDKQQSVFLPSSSISASTWPCSPEVPSLLPVKDPLLSDLLTRQQRLVVINDEGTPTFLSATGNQSHVLLPIIQEDKASALLYVGCRDRCAFPAEYLQGLQTMSLLIHSWLKSRNLIADLKNSMDSLAYSEQLRKALYEISEQAHLVTSQEILFISIHNIIGRFINVRNFFIALRSEQDGERFIDFPYFCDEHDGHFHGMRIKEDTKKKPSITSFLMQSGEAILLGPETFDQFCADNEIEYLGSKAYSLIGVPFYLNKLAGVVMVQSYRDILYTEKDKDLLVYAARHIGSALDKQRTIDTLRSVNEVFSRFMHYSPGYIIIKEITESYNRVLQTSDNYQDITGIPSKEMVGMAMTDLFSAEFAAKVMADDRQVVSGGVPLQLEQQWNGRTYATIKFLLSREGQTLLAAFSIDITERKKMEEALRESERKYRIIFEKSPLGVVCLDAQGRVLDLNDKFAEIMGSTREKILGYNVAGWSSEIVRKTLKKAMTGQMSSCEESYISAAGGSIKYLRGIFSPVIPGQQPSDIIATIEDITEQKSHEREQHKIEKLESLGVLAGGIAHDFNNILTGIMANISFARVLIDPRHQICGNLADAEKASRRAAELAQQLLTFAKGGEPQKKIIAAEDFIPEAVSLMLRGSNVRAVVDIADDIDAVEADAGQISQVLNNILINGVQAMPGGGTISITAGNERIETANNYKLAPGSYIKIVVQDEGCGIAREDREKIFDPYFTTKPTGTGLGLASAYSIVTRHDGHILVDSIVDQGTNFTIYLPSIGSSYAQHLESAQQDARRHEGGAILVMDDEQMIRDIADSMLTHLGYSVTTCDKGEDAIALYRQSLARKQPYRAVIMDLTIPGGIGGIEAARRILAESASACLIVSSGYSNDPVMANHQDYGFIAAIAKPYSMSQIEQILQSLP